MTEISSIKDLVDASVNSGKKIYEVVLEHECASMDKPREELIEKMMERIRVMDRSVKSGLDPDLKSSSGLSGGGAFKLNHAIENGIIKNGVLPNAMVKALAVSEYNACMGRIVAAPTGGSAGIIPAVLLAAGEEYGIPHDKLALSLFTAGAIGMVIATKASISGAEGGCQAECGSASAMAAAALVELLGGTPMMSAHACAFALKGTMGLVCDPVAGLVEVPCVKRNASGAVNAFTAAYLALAGIESVIPADEVIDAMGDVGRQMSYQLKETAEGGIAATPTAKNLSRSLEKP
jgi:L-serine dehydratase